MMNKKPMAKTPGFLTSKPAPTVKTPAVKAPKVSDLTKAAKPPAVKMPKVSDLMKTPTGMIPKPKPAAMPKSKPSMPSMGMPMKKGKK